jgi:prolyl-tRNA editing enzyme YbaK/EbsC (Cys-tRNA(Pro) deacylase)
MHQEHLKRISSFIEANDVECEIIEFELSCNSVQEASAATGDTPDEFIKSICFISKEDLIVGIVLGTDRASMRRVQKAVFRDEIRMASSDEVMGRTGYPIGGVPPFGYNAHFLIDKKVLCRPVVWAGGGSGKVLIRVSPAEIMRVTKGRLVNIRE